MRCTDTEGTSFPEITLNQIKECQRLLKIQQASECLKSGDGILFYHPEDAEVLKELLDTLPEEQKRTSIAIQRGGYLVADKKYFELPPLEFDF